MLHLQHGIGLNVAGPYMVPSVDATRLNFMFFMIGIYLNMKLADIVLLAK